MWILSMLHLVHFSKASLPQNLQDMELIFWKSDWTSLSVGQLFNTVFVLFSKEHVGEKRKTVEWSFRWLVIGFLAGGSKWHSFFYFVLKSDVSMLFLGFGSILLFGLGIHWGSFGSGSTKSTRILFMVVRPVHLWKLYQTDPLFQ